MKYLLIAFAFLYSFSAIAQVPKDYTALTKKADSLYLKNDYKNACQVFTKAFKAYNWNAFPSHRYDAACSWAMSGNKDSAFSLLQKLAYTQNYSAYNYISKDANLMSLQTDKRWKPLLESISANSSKGQVKFMQPLTAQLDTMYQDYQRYREMLQDAENPELGVSAAKISEIKDLIRSKDSINVIKLKSLLAKYGWPGPEEVGAGGCKTVFLVMKEADLKTREQYLPVMREAVKNKKCQANNMAIIEDRLAFEQGKKQIWGSHVEKNTSTGAYFVSPINDEANVNKRRAEMGMPPLEDYLKPWNISWKSPEN